MRSSRRLAWLLALVVLPLASAGAQAPAPPPAGGNLFVLDPAGTPIGEIPANIKQLKGMLEVVLKDGVPMLKASAVSEFLITLPRPLPRDFTLEFDLVPKACCNPQDLSFEGTPTINQGGGSAHVMWDSDGNLAVVGGGDYYEAPMPEELRTTLPGMLTSVVAVIEGPSVRLYTNGRRHYTLDRTFARGRVLRVFLGGQDDNTQAVHLAGMRILAGAVPPTQVATSSSALSASSLITASQGTISAVSGSTPAPGTPVGTPTPVQVSTPASPGAIATGPVTTQRPVSTTATTPMTASQSQASTGGSLPTTVSSVSVVQGTAGPVVSWQPVAVRAGYSVKRWKIDDLVCCNAASPTSPGVTGPPWQDAPLPVAGTYVYEVTATMSGGTASGQAQFVHLGTGGRIATVSSPTALPVVNAPTGPATTVGPIAGTPPPTPTSSSTLTPPPTRGTATLASTGFAPVPYIQGTPASTWLSWGSADASSPLADPAITYSVQRWLKSDPTCCSTQVTGLTTKYWRDEGVQWPGIYIYRVIAHYPDGRVGFMDTPWLRPDPINPTNFRTAAVSSGTVTLQWDPVPGGVAWYELSGPGVPNGAFQAVNTIFTVRGLSPGTHTWRIGSIYSSPNAPAPVSTAPAAFPQLTVVVP